MSLSEERDNCIRYETWISIFKHMLLPKVYQNSNFFLSAISPTKNKHVLLIVPQNFAFYLLGWRARSSKLAVIWTHDRGMRGMGLSSTWRHKMLLQSKVSLWRQIKIRPIPLMPRSWDQITASFNDFTWLAKFWVTMLTYVCFGWGKIYSRNEKYLSKGAL